MASEDKDENHELLKLKLEVWKTVIATQQHFNDLEMRIRNFAILILSAFIGAIGVSFKSGFSLTIYNINIPASAVLSLAATFIWLLFYFMDVYWYHPLLKGAVEHGKIIENNINPHFDNIIGLTKTVSNNSPQKILFWKNLHSTGKANVFYFSILIVLLISSILLCSMDKQSPVKIFCDIPNTSTT